MVERGLVLATALSGSLVLVDEHVKVCQQFLMIGSLYSLKVVHILFVMNNLQGVVKMGKQ